MCDVCKAIGLDSQKVNGPKHREIKRELYTVWDNYYAVASFCYVHDIQLFTIGESSFFKRYPEFLEYLYSNSGVHKRKKNTTAN